MGRAGRGADPLHQQTLGAAGVPLGHRDSLMAPKKPTKIPMRG